MRVLIIKEAGERIQKQIPGRLGITQPTIQTRLTITIITATQIPTSSIIPITQEVRLAGRVEIAT